MAARGRERFIYVNRWQEFQHYKKDARPAWIKTYTRLLHDDAYMGLSEHRALLLHRLWLEYASSGARLLLDTRSLSRRLGLRVTTADLESLSHAGFIRICSRATLEKLYNDSSPEKIRSRKEKAFDFEEARPLQNGHSEKFKIPELRSVT